VKIIADNVPKLAADDVVGRPVVNQSFSMAESRITICVGNLHNDIERKDIFVAAPCMGIVVTSLLILSRPPWIPKPVVPLYPCLQVPHPLSSLPSGFDFRSMWTPGWKKDEMPVFSKTLDYSKLRSRDDTRGGFSSR